MADDVQVRVDPAQVARLEKALTEAQTILGRSAPQAVGFASALIARSAAARAKPGKKSRIAPDPVTGGKTFLVIWRRQPPKPTIITRTWKRNDPAGVIRNRGLSRNVWRRLQGAAASLKTNGMRIGDKSRYSLFSNRDVTIGSLLAQLTYQEKAYPGIATNAVAAGVSALNYRINEAVGVAVDRANRG